MITTPEIAPESTADVIVLLESIDQYLDDLITRTVKENGVLKNTRKSITLLQDVDED